MAVNRVEVAIDCDDPMGEGIEVLGLILSVLGMDSVNDVEVILTASDDGSPILVAVIAKHDEGNHDNDPV